MTFCLNLKALVGLELSTFKKIKDRKREKEKKKNTSKAQHHVSTKSSEN